MKKIETIIYTDDLEETEYVVAAKEKGLNCLNVLDARTAVYMATGLSAQKHAPVIVCVNGNNASRSAFAGMTEAYYRNLPVVLMTFGRDVDYCKELADVVYGHYVIKEASEIDNLLDKKMPMHVELDVKCSEVKKISSITMIKLLKNILDENDYLYFGQGIKAEEGFNCKTVVGGLPNCLEGSLSNVLGASLTKIRKRYIGVVSEEEFIHDINTIGNINANDLILFIILSEKKNRVVSDYAKSLDYKVFECNESNLTGDDLAGIVRNNCKSVLIVSQEAV